MNSAKFVDGYIKELKESGLPKQKQVWNLAMACIGWPYIFGDRGQYCTPGQRKAVYNKHPDQTGLIDKCQVLKGSKPGCDGCKWLPGGERVRSFDCRGFPYWNLLQIYGWKLMGTGATAQWNTESNWKAKGKVNAMPENTLCCLFYPCKDNPKKMQHTGFYLNGETIECANGVQHFTSMSSKWTDWAVPACIEEDVPTPTPVPAKKPTLKKGSKGEYVTLAQTMLIQKGYSLEPYGADGKFGATTEKAVKEFQKDHGLAANGVIGESTWNALESTTPVTRLYTVSIPHLTEYKAEALVKQYSGSSMIEERG